MKDFFEGSVVDNVRETHQKGRQASFDNYVACLRGSLLGICAKFPYGDVYSDSEQHLNPRERHVLCT